MLYASWRLAVKVPWEQDIMLSTSFQNSFLSGAVRMASPIVLSIVLKSFIMVLKFTWNTAFSHMFKVADFKGGGQNLDKNLLK